MGTRNALPPVPGKPRLFRVWLLRTAAALALGLGVFLGWNAAFFDVLSGIPFSRAYADREGRLFHIFLADDERYRLRTRLADFPPALVEALLLQEDRYFYGHWGINPAAMFRAAWETYVKKDRRVGASTITMQLARLRYGLYTRDIPGKIRQIFRAFFLEICLSKQEILEAYLNLAPLGGNIEGFGAAAWYYFDKDPQDLTLGEILTLVVIPQNPGGRAPLRGDGPPEELMEARRILYGSWAAAHPEDLSFRAELEMPPFLVNRFPRRAPHFAEYLRYGEGDGADPAETGGALVTTLDRNLQNILERELEAYLVRNRGWGINNGSMLLLDWTCMEVLAAVGSASYANDGIQGQVNGFASKRSPGSTLKPFVYAMAMEQGLIHPETMLKDSPRGFSEYTPDNYQGAFKGPVKAWFALVDSRNIPAVQLAASIRNPDLHDFLAKAGVTGLKEKAHYGLSVVLGTADLSMLELAGLYAALPNGGALRSPRFFLNGAAGEPARLLSPQAAAITLDMLERNPAPDDTRYGAGRAMPVAYKTGTSIGFKDAWSIAVFDRYVLAVWLGNFSGEGNPAFVGRLTATPLQFSVIDAVVSDIPAAPPPRPMPEGLALVSVCAVSGCLPNDNCPQLTDTWFIPGVSPITRCRIHRRVYIDTRTGYRSDETEGPHITSEVREFWPTDLLEIFAQAGLPRFLPPPYPPKSADSAGNSAGDRAGESAGFPPSIISPLGNTTYILRPQDERRNRIVLLAESDQDSGDIFWFANTLFLGRAKPYERFLWQPEPGLWDIAAVDSRGRSAGLRVSVELEPR
ncbi:MAG: penicillin-binding protein 1C [Treponema sp.]|jgi:penicillin-binding protein 1C|nr:penicillin-binding protein 1C [Treponema sp.]